MRLRTGSMVCFALGAMLAVPNRALGQDPVHWTMTAPRSMAPGATITTTLTAQIDEGWYVYALSQKPGGPIPMHVALPKNAPAPFTLGAVTTTTPVKRKFDPNFQMETEIHEEIASYDVKNTIAARAAGNQVLRLVITFQTCNERLCLPPKDEELRAEIVVGRAAAIDAARTNPAALAARPSGETPSPSATASSPSPIPAATRRKVPDLAVSATTSTLPAYLSAAALMGALSLLTPCVFPMVPITVSYFTNRAGRTRRDALMQAVVYGLGIVLTFTALGVTLAVAFGAAGLNRFAADPWLNLGVTALFVAFAFSLFGVWDFALPSRWLTAISGADRGRGRFAGTLLMGLAFTLTSFTCTAPFLGTLLVVASQGDWQWPLAGMLVFSSVFALPFVVLAIAPQWIAALPKSGPWLVAMKATMGLLELAAAMKFLSNVDLVWRWGIFTREVVLTTWIAIAMVLVVYLTGILRIGHAPRLGRPGLMRLAGIAATIAIVAWLGTGLRGQRLGELEAFLPPADLSRTAPGGELAWMLNDYDTALQQAQREDRPILIDFTGYTCTNCRWMEANMFTRDDVARELARFIRVRLYTDGRGEMYSRHQAMEQELFGTVALPYYAVIAPTGDPIVAFGGLTRDPAEFLNFLRRGLSGS